ncbi:bifunctional diaminohydroxyphosphoribosylaminopyrimidine deaminase/5-amino-6-(5-phosphoribosylamino)uracil reductase RibD [Halieaceae bacterium IMCC14734]|uniref:Riboflavin biosynthesis protein RibD n=1 Tax=Candidatus Litorirhabdus singularis TaxID=2518993 RepID=A0ABT3TKG1_9GAMM|nr:bifunctional diaminohydroxyphosphoribosylaminopyrimidine deaminase/5-amino-6-(5-phosphoribosylamino)uracil reductase RibD [Candidatus Litorirhabdus singularis]MCX2982773.1 bifunctional diaminohydroxyphosphoribosylaminopyrimidine deaminase/5-amino-6-(5-phosphoribosylamino)uracil reductase RibD [Candidatus Litorirhabdus singularis]
MLTSFDSQMMARALQLAELGRYSTRPNPSVGCVLVSQQKIVAEGRTRPAGGDHAEVDALRQCTDNKGVHAYVTLEPCSHQGRTGPCSQALIEAGVAVVFVAMRDPNPDVSGTGIEQLRAAGISVVEMPLEAVARPINAGFFQRMETGRPRVRLKMASSLDGRTAMANGESQWITGPAARADVQRWRALSGAIVTGVGTVLQDDPALTVRESGYDIPQQPLRVIVDSKLRTPLHSKILQQQGVTLIAHCSEEPGTELARQGAQLLGLPANDGRVDLPALMSELARRQCNDILVECGAELTGSLLAAQWVDEILLYMAPALLGSAARPLAQLPFTAMAQKLELDIEDVRQVGADLRLQLRPRYQVTGATAS